MKPKQVPAIITLLLLASSAALHAAELHVSVTGNDTNPGTQAAALRTIQAAADKAQPGDTVTVHDGAPLPLKPMDPALRDLPGDPANEAAAVEWDKATGRLRLRYDGATLFDGQVRGAELSSVTSRKKQAFTQTIVLSGKGLALDGLVTAGPETIAAETRGAAQQAFPLVRTVNGGPSQNLRNNAVYDRKRDWMLAGADRVAPQPGGGFRFSAAGDAITLTFKPRFYQRHKNIGWFRPWTYKVRQDSITGWCSWWAFRYGFGQRENEQLLAVWKQKRFADYGYRFVQIDECFHQELGKGQARPVISGSKPSTYVARGPATWLEWRADNFPKGIAGYVSSCREAGFEPGMWTGTFFTDQELITAHPDWFIRGKDGKPFIAPWASCGVDATNDTALEELVRRTFRGIHAAGITYVKVDQLRHYLYDNLNQNPEYCRQRGVTPAEMFRKYLGAARQELGPDTFLLSCWGVLPESVGIADACRIGGDGYGPVTMQQYNSWNGIVWRNDPDHCDVYPKFKPAETGNVTKTAAVTAAPADTVIRPALASIAGCLLMLSDKPEVYQDETNLVGLRRASPVLFSVPGQLFDFDDSKTSNVIKVPRESITHGGSVTPIDANQFGPVCPWWLNEFDRSFEHWSVLHRINWSQNPSGTATITFADLGLDLGKKYLIYEFWSKQFLGIRGDNFQTPAIVPMGLSSYAIREALDRPQVISTSRHLSQGGVDLVNVEWRQRRLTGRSRVVAGDRYELVVHVPAPHRFSSATFAGRPAEATVDGQIARAAFVPETTGEIDWWLEFASN